jgi:hypothetical protein
MPNFRPNTYHEISTEILSINAEWSDNSGFYIVVIYEPLPHSYVAPDSWDLSMGEWGTSVEQLRNLTMPKICYILLITVPVCINSTPPHSSCREENEWVSELRASSVRNYTPLPFQQWNIACLASCLSHIHRPFWKKISKGEILNRL